MWNSVYIVPNHCWCRIIRDVLIFALPILAFCYMKWRLYYLSKSLLCSRCPRGIADEANLCDLSTSYVCVTSDLPGFKALETLTYSLALPESYIKLADNGGTGDLHLNPDALGELSMLLVQYKWEYHSTWLASYQWILIFINMQAWIEVRQTNLFMP